MTTNINGIIFHLGYQRLSILNNHIEAFYKDEGNSYKVIVSIQNLWNSTIKSRKNIEDLQEKIVLLPDFIEKKKCHFLYIFNHVGRKDRPAYSWCQDMISNARTGSYKCKQNTKYFQEEIKAIKEELKKQKIQEKTFSINDINKTYRFPIVTMLIIMACIGIFILNPSSDIYGVSGNSMLNGQYYTIFTYGFLHGGLLHLANNCVSLGILGSMLERRIGKLQYVLLLLIATGYSGLITGLCKLIFNERSVITVGISGFVFAVYAALYMYQKKYERRSGIIFIYIMISLLLGFLNPSTDNVVHIVGAATGILFMSLYFMVKTINKNILFIKYAECKGSH